MVPSVNNKKKKSPFYSVFCSSKYKTRASAKSERVVQCDALWKPGLKAGFRLALWAVLARNVGRNRSILARNVMFVPLWMDLSLGGRSLPLRRNQGINLMPHIKEDDT